MTPPTKPWTVLAIVTATLVAFAQSASSAEVAKVDFAPPDESGLERLAALLSEVPESSRTQSVDTYCGLEGHCNFARCAAPSCQRGQEATCTCQAESRDCADDHSWDPFDNDKHPVYSCTCSCVAPTSTPPRPPEEECRLYSPVDGKCLLSERPDPGDVDLRFSVDPSPPGF